MSGARLESQTTKQTSLDLKHDKKVFKIRPRGKAILKANKINQGSGNDSTSLFMSSSEAEDNESSKNKLFFHKDEQELIKELKTQIRQVQSVALDTRSEAVPAKRLAKRRNSAQRSKKEGN